MVLLVTIFRISCAECQCKRRGSALFGAVKIPINFLLQFSILFAWKRIYAKGPISITMGSFGAGGWKNASTLIVAARNRLADRSDHRFSFGRFTFDYSVMMLKRSARSSFFAKAYVFPGGAVEAADFDGTWLLLLAQHGLSRQRLMSQFMRANRPRPPIYSTVCGTEPEAEIGFRIAAIRETFEETGVLFCRGQATEEPAWSGDDDIRHWQERIHDDPRQFQELCRQKNVYPDVSSLYEWSNWLTPTGMGGKRYDTIFYIRVLDTVPDTRIDCGEITDLMVKISIEFNLFLRRLKTHCKDGRV